MRQNRRPGKDTVEYRENTGRNTSDVCQRMAVMASDNWKDQKDALVWNNLQYAEKMAGGPIGDLKSHKVWRKLEDGEEVRIVEHGQVGGLGAKKRFLQKSKPYTARDIAGSMFARKTGVPDDIKIGRITFQSCYAGAGGNGSLVSGMAAELARYGRVGVPVEGRTGIAFGFEGIGEKTAETAADRGKQAYLQAMLALQHETTLTTNVNIFKSQWTYNDPWILIGKTSKQWKKMDASQRGKEVAFEMKGYWKKVDALMTQMGGFKAPKDAIKEVISKK